MSEFKHGVYSLERETSFKVVEVPGDIIVFVGASPIHLAKEPKINEPVLAYSIDEVQKYLGFSEENTLFSLNRVVDVFMKLEGLTPVGFINVLDPAKHKTDQAEKDITLVNAEYTEEVHGIILSSVVVKQGVTVLVENTDYYKQYTSTGYVKITKVTGGAITGTALKLSYSKVDPSKITDADIIGTKDLVTGKETGLEVLNKFEAVYGKGVKGIGAPKYSKSSAVKTVMGAKAESLKAKAVVEIEDDVYYLGAPQKKKDQNATLPTQIVTYGYTTLGEKAYELSIHELSVMNRLDNKNEGRPCESPSNKPIYADGLCIFVGGKKVPLALSEKEANYLNENGICTARNNGGLVLWGNKTAAYPTNSDPKDTQIPWKRGMFYYRKEWEKGLASAVDGKVTRAFLDNILNSWKQKFNSEASKGYLFAGEIICDPRKNMVGDLVVGNLTYQIKLTYYPTAQAITGEFEIDVDKLSKLTA